MKSFKEIYISSNFDKFFCGSWHKSSWVDATVWARNQSIREQISKKGKRLYHISQEKVTLSKLNNKEFGFFVSVNPFFCIDFMKYRLFNKLQFKPKVFLHTYVTKKELNIFNPMSENDIKKVSSSITDPILQSNFMDETFKATIKNQERYWEIMEQPIIVESIKNSSSFDGYVSFGELRYDDESDSIYHKYIKKFGSFEKANNFSLFNPEEVLELVDVDERQLLSFKG